VLWKFQADLAASVSIQFVQNSRQGHLYLIACVHDLMGLERASYERRSHYRVRQFLRVAVPITQESNGNGVVNGHKFWGPWSQKQEESGRIHVGGVVGCYCHYRDPSGIAIAGDSSRAGSGAPLAMHQ
jgi:hypothetical protein